MKFICFTPDGNNYNGVSLTKLFPNAMTDNLQYLCDAEGQTLAVVVPISIWQDLMAKDETAYLLSNPKMRERLLTAKNRQTGMSLEAACEKLGI